MLKTLIIILFLSVTTVFAQHKPFQFGIKGGASVGWFATDAEGYSNEGADFSGSWGLVADIFLMEHYTFTTGFDVIYLNSSLSYPDFKPHETLTVMVPGTTIRDYRTKYLEIPLSFIMTTNDIGKIRIFAQIGIGVSFLLSAKADDNFTADDGSIINTETVDVYDDMTFARVSLILGTGIEIPIQKSTFIRTGIKFDNAFINVLKGYNNVTTDIKNNGRNSFLEYYVSIIF